MKLAAEVYRVGNRLLIMHNNIETGQCTYTAKDINLHGLLPITTRTDASLLHGNPVFIRVVKNQELSTDD